MKKIFKLGLVFIAGMLTTLVVDDAIKNYNIQNNDLTQVIRHDGVYPSDYETLEDGSTKIYFEKEEIIAPQSYNETSIYEMNDNYDGVYHLPLRAIEMNDNGIRYFLLVDNEDSVFISYDDLKDGQNYIGNARLISDGNEKLYSLIESVFEFSPEVERMLDMNNPENKEFFESEAARLLDKSLKFKEM